LLACRGLIFCLNLLAQALISVHKIFNLNCSTQVAFSYSPLKKYMV